MASVTFPAGLGGDGTTVTDDADPSTGLANGGHRVRFVPALAQTVIMAQTASDKAAAALADAQQTAADRTAVASDKADAESARQGAEDLYGDLQAISNAVQDSADNKDASATSAANAATSETTADQHRADALAARDAAQLASGVYDDTAAGIAATSDGDYFTVPDTVAPELFLTLYRNDTGSATEIDTYPTAAHMDESVQIAYAQRAVVSTIEQRLRWKYDLDA